MYSCNLCLERKEGLPKVIGLLTACHACVKESVVPRFYQAMKYEAEYPVSVGHSASDLDPRQFLDYFDEDADTNSFLEQWDRKVAEYQTPYKSRFYCRCENFLFAKPEGAARTNIHCVNCNATVCYPCGEPLTDPAAPHVCPGEEEDPLKGLTRGRDYQTCPRPNCGFVVQLSEACNHMTCKCGLDFCFICGVEANAHSGHWNPDMPCAQYNHPDDANATYADAAQRQWEVEQAQLGPRERALGEMARGDDDWNDLNFITTIFPAAFAQSIDLPVGGSPDTDNLRRVQDIVNLMTRLPPFPANFDEMTDSERYNEEYIMHELPEPRGLEASPLGQVMLQHTHELDNMLKTARRELRRAGRDARRGRAAVPEWLPIAIDLMEALRAGIHIYTARVRARLWRGRYLDRDTQLQTAYDARYQESIAAHYPRFYQLLAVYDEIASLILYSIPEAMERGGIDEDEATAREIDEATARAVATANEAFDQERQRRLMQ